MKDSIQTASFRLFFIWFLSACCALSCFAQPPAGESLPINLSSPIKVSVTTEKESIAVAEPLSLTITVHAPENVQVSFPPKSEQVGNFDVISMRDDLDIPDGKHRKSIRRYKLECIRSGEQKIPNFEIAFVDRRDTPHQYDSVTTEPISIKVMSSIEQDANPLEFNDIKPAIEFQQSGELRRGLYLGGAIGLAAIFIFAFLIVWVRRPKSGVPPVPWAMAKIDDLSRQFDENGDGNAIHQKLSNVLREFVDRQYAIEAPRMTTIEFLEELKNNSELPDSQKDQMKRFLQTADMIKFAAASANTKLVDDAFGQARDFVRACDVAETKSNDSQDGRQED